jgi:hypothetical protein
MTQYIGTDPNGAGGYVNPWGNRFGVMGESYSAEGVIGISGKGDGVWGATNGPVSFGVFGLGAVGVAGSSQGVSGVWGYSINDTGVLGSDAGYGDGVFGQSASGQGINGESTNGYGVFGYSENSDAISGFKDTAGGGAAGSFLSGQLIYLGGRSGKGARFQIIPGTAGSFWGNVEVNGNLTVSGNKGFKIDHPLHPAGKFLYHSSVESPDMKNIYDGIATLNRKGEAVVTLPSWFSALNKDFRYQLTPVGAAAPSLHVAARIRANQFRIAGGRPKMEVSWQVTGIRQDRWANAHRLPLEEGKGKDRGRYLHPDLYEEASDKDLSTVLYSDAARSLNRIRRIREAVAQRVPVLKQMEKRVRHQPSRRRDAGRAATRLRRREPSGASRKRFRPTREKI